MKTILVTGGAGFIGSHLTEALLENGFKVIILDNFHSYYPPIIKRKNVEEIHLTMNNRKIPLSNFLLTEGDIREESVLESLFNTQNIYMVIHLAAMAGVRKSIENPLLYFDVNVQGTLRLLEKCRKKSIKKFIFASSSSVYGNNNKIPFSEKDSVDKPISPYAASKKSGELLCYNYHHLYDMSIACLRFFTVYGPRQRPDLAIHKFSHSIINDIKIPFYGDGSSSRDYTYISDIIQGILGAVHWIENDEIKKYDIFNLGGDKSISLKSMVETIENTLNKKADLQLLPLQPGDMKITSADISHSQKQLGYMPTIPFQEGIRKFITWKLNSLKIKEQDYK